MNKSWQKAKMQSKRKIDGLWENSEVKERNKQKMEWASKEEEQ